MTSIKALFTKYLSHLSGYIGHVLAIIALVPSAQLDPRLRLAIAVAGLVTTASDHGYKAGSDALRAAVSAAVSSVGASVAAAKPVVLGILLALLCVVGGGGLTACATLQKVDAVVTSPAAQPFITTGALVAVVAAEAKGISPVQINTIAKAALAADTGTGATLAAIGAAIDAQVAKLNLPLVDVAIIKTVELEFANYITQQTKANPTVAQTQAAVADVLNAFILASGG